MLPDAEEVLHPHARRRAGLGVVVDGDPAPRRQRRAQRGARRSRSRAGARREQRGPQHAAATSRSSTSAREVAPARKGASQESSEASRAAVGEVGPGLAEMTARGRRPGLAATRPRPRAAAGRASSPSPGRRARRSSPARAAVGGGPCRGRGGRGCGPLVPRRRRGPCPTRSTGARGPRGPKMASTSSSSSAAPSRMRAPSRLPSRSAATTNGAPASGSSAGTHAAVPPRSRNRPGPPLACPTRSGYASASTRPADEPELAAARSHVSGDLLPPIRCESARGGRRRGGVSTRAEALGDVGGVAGRGTAVQHRGQHARLDPVGLGGVGHHAGEAGVQREADGAPRPTP